MENTGRRSVATLLLAWREGDAQALERLMPLVYEELHELARRQLGHERPDHSLQPTALLHEAYLRLVGADMQWDGRVHFFAVVARVMRHVLVDHARGRARDKRGGGLTLVTLDEGLAAGATAASDILALNDALERLAKLDERRARAIELHYFGGLTYEEVATAMEISPATVHRELRLAKAWLRRELEPGDDQPS